MEGRAGKGGHTADAGPAGSRWHSRGFAFTACLQLHGHPLQGASLPLLAVALALCLLWNRPRRPLRALACEAEADPAQQHLDSGTGEGCRAAWAPARVEAQLEANPAGSSGAGLHRVCPRGRVLALYPSTRRPTAVQAPRQAPPGAQRSSGVKKHWKQSTQKPGRVPQTGRWETGHHGGKGTAASTWDFTLGFVLPHALHLLYQHS